LETFGDVFPSQSLRLVLDTEHNEA